MFLLAACEKPNDLARLEDEATVVDKSSQLELQKCHRRVEAILQRSKLIPPNVPGINETGKLLGEAVERLRALDAIFKPGSDGKSSFGKQAEGFVKDGNLDKLGGLIDETRAKLDEEGTVINSRLTSVEDWESDAEAKLKAAPAAPQPETPAHPTGAETPAEMPK